jgi:PKD repeat protein
MTVAPIAKPGGPYTGVAGSALTANGSGSSHPAGSIVGWAWTWGDGASTAKSSSPSASHTYQTSGTYTITLTVTDNAGATASATTIATISSQSGGGGGNAGTVVLWAANTPTTKIHGSWTRHTDATAAGGSALWNPNASAAKVSPALASPRNYFEQTFQASAGTVYHLWVRMRAQNNSFANDSIHVQFNDAIDPSSHGAIDRIGTTGSAEVVLQNGSNGAAEHNWGWADNGWGTLGANIAFASTGAHTIRIQQREDGALVDQIVLSPSTYLTSPPGPLRDDVKILPYTDGSPQSAGSTADTAVMWTSDVAASAIHGKWQRLTAPTAAGGSALENPNAGAAKIAPALASPANYFETTFSAKANVAYHVWIRLRAQNNSLSNDSVHAQFNDALDSTKAAYARIGTTHSAEFVLQDGTGGAADHGWGWTDNGWGSPGPSVFFATTGTHRIRIQQREDGAIVDQIVVSADAYLSAAPGERRDDTTVVAK